MCVHTVVIVRKNSIVKHLLEQLVTLTHLTQSTIIPETVWTYIIDIIRHQLEEGVLQQWPHEGPLLEVLDQALADEVVEVGTPVGRPLQRGRRIPRNLRTKPARCHTPETGTK